MSYLNTKDKMMSEKKKTILLIGKNGQVGWELNRCLAPLGELVAIDYPEIDLTDDENIKGWVRKLRPQLIVNAAAYTAVDKAEEEKDRAMSINGVAPGVLAREALKCGSVLIHYSTDYVFDGSKEIPYGESDDPNPLNAYGKTKLAGDQAIETSDTPHFIFRTSWVYGWRGQNFLLTMLKLAREREELKVVDDQIGTPNWSRDLAEATAQIVSQGTHDLRDFFAEHSGIYNLSSQGSTSWYQFAKRIFESDPNKEEHKLKKLLPIATSEYKTAAERPKRSILSSEKLSETFGIEMPRWERALELWSGDS